MTDIVLGGCSFEIYNWLEEETEFVFSKQEEAEEVLKELNSINSIKNLYVEEDPWVIRTITDERIQVFQKVIEDFSEAIQERFYRDRKIKNYKIIR